MPVVDGGGKLLGQVTFDDVIDVVEAEQTEDLLKFGGTSADEELAAPWHDAVRSRLPWLLTNLVHRLCRRCGGRAISAAGRERCAP